MTESTPSPIAISRHIAEMDGLGHIRVLAKEEQIAGNEERTADILTGCAQWLATALTLPPDGNKIFMFQGQIQQMLQLIIIDTQLYEAICRNHARKMIHHHPISRSDAVPPHESFDWTIRLLEDAFGDTLSREFGAWRILDRNGLLVPSGFISN